MMSTSNWIRPIMILAAFALVAVAASGAETAGERYIVILKSRSGPAPDVARLGGTITFRQADQVNVTLPREALAALRADPLVRYVQPVAGAGDAPLIGEPEEPTPGTPRRLAPHATAGNQSWSRSYSYDDAGNITNIGSQQFVYDALGRLNEMATSGTTTEQYGYDRYGNQTSRTTGGVPQSISTDSATNRLSTGYTYDPAGNVTSGDGYTLSYDALGQAATKTYTAATTFNETYIYSAGEERIGVQTSNSGETSSWWYWSVRDEGGKVLRQYRSSALDPTQTALWIEDYVYRDGLLLGAERPPTLGGRRHFHLDHLGSPRLITSNDGQTVSFHDYLPFGGETTSVYQETGAGFDREDPMKFTGHERDYAGGFGREGGGDAIDYMHARYYSPTVGRFLSPDPLGGNLGEPQSWNRFVYVLNSAVNAADPLGLMAQQSGGGGGLLMDEDCPKDTDLCVEVHGTDPKPPPAPVPQLDTRPLHFFWDAQPSVSIADIHNPLTGLTVREHWNASSQGAAAFIDGVIPFGDPLSALYSDGSVDGTDVSKEIGVITRDTEISILAGAAGRAGVARGGWLNSNRYVRIGFGKGPGARKVFRISGNVISWLKESGHIDLWRGGPFGR